MDHTQTLDWVITDTVLDKVEVALGLVDRAGQELNDALILEPGADGLEHIEALLHRASAGLRCELKIAGRSGHGVPAQSGAKARLYTCGECGFADEAFGALQSHVYEVHLGIAV
jgi:hypothetical protein